MANKIKILVALLLAVSLGAIVHSFTSIPKGYAASQNQSTFKQVLLQSKDKLASVSSIRGDGGSDSVVSGKIITVGDDFIEVLKPNSSFTENLHSYYIPFTSMQRVERYSQDSITIYLQ
jgi:hypothetical protein